MFGKGGKGKDDDLQDDGLQFSDLSSSVEQSQEPQKEKPRKSVRMAHGNIAPIGAAPKRKDEGQQNLKEEEHQAEVRTQKFVLAQMADDTWTVAYVMKARKLRNAAKEYYVHYEEYNRRMDRWVERAQIRVGSALSESEAQEVLQYTQAKEAKQKEKKTISRREAAGGAHNPSGGGAAEEDKRQTFFNNDEHFGMNENQVQEHEAMTKFKTIEFIQFGPYRSQTWYYSPYPAHCQDIKLLFICENCLNFWPKENEYLRHVPRCKLKTQPPGDQIYREGKISMFEVDGQQQQVYCENLAYMAKLFLDHKYLKFDTSPFLFYLLTEWDHERQRFNLVGYFSKEKFDFFQETRTGPSSGPKAKLENNLSCILVMPFHQKKGYGKFLVDFSYKLSLIEKRAGTPERPLSDLGHKLYTSYWGFTLINLLLNTNSESLSIADIRDQTGMIDPDIESTLKDLNILQYRSGQWVLISEKESLQAKLKSFGRPSRYIDSAKIRWTPYKK